MGDGEIKNAIRRLAGVNTDQVNLTPAEVVEVDISTRTCTVESTGKSRVTIPGVQLMASIDDGFLLVPAEGSTVYVSYSTYNKPFISLFSELSKIVLIVGDSTIEVTADLIKINGGLLGGLVKVQNLTTKLNNLEKFVNNLATKFDTHVHPGVQSGAGSTAVTATPVASQLTVTNQDDIENKKVKHG